jgi:signal transduction histidine kinase
MRSEEGTSLIKNKFRNSSIAVKLLIPLIAIFIFMMVFSSYLLTLKQEQMLKSMEKQIIQNGLEGELDQELTLVIDEASVRTTAEYQLFTGYVILGAILIGGAVIVFIVLRILRPLKELTEKTNRIDINNVPKIRDDIVLENGGSEIRELSLSFQSALDKIYEDYEKQKRFSTNVAHELRTPLAVLLTKVDVFKRQVSPKDEEVKAFLVTLERNILRLSELVEDVLFLSRDHEPKCRMVSVKELVEEVIFDLEDKAETKDITLSVSGEDTAICTDDMLLERAIFNLVDNAIKYTQNGGKCGVDLQKEGNDLRICVRDNGPGIPDDQKKLVFNLFYRADESRNRKTGGSGVGLAIVHDVVQRLGGRISVSDNVPRGCIFEILLPSHIHSKEKIHE